LNFFWITSFSDKSWLKREKRYSLFLVQNKKFILVIGFQKEFKNQENMEKSATHFSIMLFSMRLISKIDKKLSKTMVYLVLEVARKIQLTRWIDVEIILWMEMIFMKRMEWNIFGRGNAAKEQNAMDIENQNQEIKMELFLNSG
jgi:hypothetical protein